MTPNKRYRLLLMAVCSTTIGLYLYFHSYASENMIILVNNPISGVSENLQRTGQTNAEDTTNKKELLPSNPQASDAPINQPEEVIPDRKHNLTDCTARKPVVSIPHWQRVKHRKKWNEYQLPLVVMGPAGRMGNMMSNYATIYAIGKAYDASVGVTRDLYGYLVRYFPNLTLPVIDVPKNDRVVLPFLGSYVYADKEAAAAGLLGPHVFLGQGSPAEIQLFQAYPCDMRREFTFHPYLQEKVKAFWLENKNVTKDCITVGFHIRRTDYAKYVKERHERLPNKTYYKSAMDFYRKKFSKVIFIVATDDQNFTKNTFQNLTDVIHTPGAEPPEDMAILASCDHSIMTVGTFGLWTAYLAGGYVVYPEGFQIKNYPLQKDRYDLIPMEFFVPIPY